MSGVMYERLLAAATQATGLADFGDDGFRTGLRVIAADLEASSLAPEVANTLRGSLVSHLQMRLKLIARRSAEPAIAEEVIKRPLFVIGLPRTGTTAFVDLLAQDPTVRAPLQWEVRHLADLHDKAAWANDPRIEALEVQLQAASQANPVVALGLHNYGARLPDECNSFLSLAMWSPSLSALAHLPRYSEWLRFAASDGAYLTHRYVLQHLQHYGPPGRWTLKSPFHVFDLPGVLAEYPDAVFVQTHRDPVQLMASNCGLLATIRRQGPGSPGRMETGREMAELWGTGLQRALAARRDPLLDGRVLDLSHRDFLADPLGTLRCVYERFGWRFDGQVEARARAWIDAPAQHLSSVKFSLEDFGLDEAKVEAAFGLYRERFGAYF